MTSFFARTLSGIRASWPGPILLLSFLATPLLAEVYLPYNPIAGSSVGEVTRTERSARWKQAQAGPGHYGFIVYRVDRRYSYVATEQLAKGVGHFFAKKKLPRGRITVRQYLRSVWNIRVPAHIPVRVSRARHCWVRLKVNWKHKGGGSQYFPHQAFGDRYFGLWKKGYRNPGVKDCVHIEFGGTINNFGFLKMNRRDKLAVFSIMLHRKVGVHGTYRMVVRFFDKTSHNWFVLPVSFIKHYQTDRTLLRTNMKRYYSTFRHTKLYKYAFKQKPDAPVSTHSLRKGTLVLGLHGGWWYPARVRSASGPTANVRWFDGTVSALNARSQVRSFNWTPGRTILCKTPWNKKWKWGQIRSIRGERLRLQFRGTDLPVRVPLGDCSEKKR